MDLNLKICYIENILLCITLIEQRVYPPWRRCRFCALHCVRRPISRLDWRWKCCSSS